MPSRNVFVGQDGTKCLMLCLVCGQVGYLIRCNYHGSEWPHRVVVRDAELAAWYLGANAAVLTLLDAYGA